MLPKFLNRTSELYVEDVGIGESSASVYRMEIGSGVIYLKLDCGKEHRNVFVEAENAVWMRSCCSVPDVLAASTSAVGSWMITAELTGVSMRSALKVADGPGQRALIRLYARAVRGLHATDVSGLEVPRWGTRELLERANLRVQEELFDFRSFSIANEGMWPEALMQGLASRAPTAARIALTHGDCSTDNVIIEPDGRVGYIDLARAGLGDPARDVAVACACLREFGGDAEAYFLREYGSGSCSSEALAWYEDIARLFWCG